MATNRLESEEEKVKYSERLKERSIFSDNGCWLFTGYKNQIGYGKIGVWFQGKAYALSAHRVSYMAFRGDIPEGMFVCHKCDVRNCVNPDHLFIGDQFDNMRDMASKGRGVTPYQNGESNPCVKTTESDVRKIRELYSTGEYSQQSLGEMFNLNRATVGMITSRKSWNHIN